MKYDVETCIKFFETSDEIFVSEMSLSDIRFVLYQTLFNKLKSELAIFSVDREAVEKKFPNFIAPYDGKEKAYEPGHYYFMTANPNDTTLADFVPKNLEKERLDCICSNDKILFIPSERFSDNFLEDEANCLGYKSYSDYKKDNGDGSYFGIEDDESLKERQEQECEFALERAFFEYSQDVTFTLKTENFEYTIYSNNPLNEDFLKDLKTGETYQSDDNVTIGYNEEVPKEIRNFLLAWVDKPLNDALNEYEADTQNSKINKNIKRN